MNIEIMIAKIHSATVTDANLNYMGSITIDQKLLDATGLIRNQKVQVVNKNNGERFDTYIMPGTSGSGTICLNGAAARLACPGDKIIIIAYGSIDSALAEEYKPKIIFVDDKNVISGTNKPKTDKQIIKWLKDPYSDSAIYKMWGNGIALPNALFVMQGIAEELKGE